MRWGLLYFPCLVDGCWMAASTGDSGWTGDNRFVMVIERYGGKAC